MNRQTDLVLCKQLKAYFVEHDSTVYMC